MSTRLKHLLRLLECSFPDIENFHEKVKAEFEKLENSKSFWSDIYVVHLKKINGHVVEIPATVFIKIPVIGENVLKRVDEAEKYKLLEKLVYFSMKENLFYQHFPHGTIPNFPFPKVYYTEEVQEEGTGGIVAENLSGKVYELEHIPGLNHKQVMSLMEAFAGFHSHLIKRKDKSYVKDFVEGAHGQENGSEEMQKRMRDEIRNFESLDSAFFGNGRIDDIMWSYDYDKKNKAQKEAVSVIPGILCHGDMNVTNMMWKKGTNDLAAIIDYQMVFVGSVAYDIVRVLTLGLEKEARKKRTGEYLEHYYRTLAGFFEGNAPFPLEELHHQYHLIFPFACNFSLFGLSIYIKMYTEGTIGVGENKHSNCKELLDRARGIVEDIEAMKEDFN